jgi:hypothetical protein
VHLKAESVGELLLNMREMGPVCFCGAQFGCLIFALSTEMLSWRDTLTRSTFGLRFGVCTASTKLLQNSEHVLL